MGKIDVEGLLKSVDIVDVIGGYVKLKKQGPEHVGACCFHDEKTASLKVNRPKQIFKCFGCGASGDAIAFLMQMGRTFLEACNELQTGSRGTYIEPEKRDSDKKAVVWTPVVPVPADAPAASFSHYRYGDASKYWTYTTAEGELIGYACRFDYKETGEDGTIVDKKDVLPYSYATDGTRSEWRFLGFTKPRPLYNLAGLKNNPEKSVIVVEGEKTADAVAEKIPSAVVVTWPGGSNNVESSDWTPLFGRKVILWPDNDDPGRFAMFGGTRVTKGGELVAVIGIFNILKDHCKELHGVNIPEGKPKHWDGADEPDWSNVDARNFVLNNLFDLHATPQEPEPPDEMPQDDPPQPPDDLEELPPLRALGYNKTQNGQNEFYVYSYKANQVIRFAVSSFSKQSLMQLADLGWWEHKFYTKSGLNLDMCAQYVMNLCYDAGVYDLENVRGIGAWLDEGRTVIHAGTHVVESGKTFKLNAFKTRYIYEANRPFGFNLRKPLTNQEAIKLIELMALLNWERPVNAHLLAGWCIVAPVCGALNWRPHLWLTGGSGTGKTTVMGMVKSLVGKMAISVQGNTSEAGIRQMIGHNARPVCFDEADSDNQADNIRLQTILSLVRSSSAHDGGLIVKGGQTGSSQSFSIRSCFAFSSISPKVTTAADKSRVTIVSLTKSKTGAERWPKVQAMIGELLTEDWCEALQARTISILPIILQNSKVFSRAAAAVFGDQRSGDQLGALLAGAYSLYSSKVIDYPAALKWVKDRDWSEITNKDLDEAMLFSFLMQQEVTVETDGGPKWERTVGELVLISAGLRGGEKISRDTANDRLKRMGLKYDDKTRLILFANTSMWIKKTLKDTNWVGSHNKILERIDGAVKSEKTPFAAGMNSRAVGIPLDYLTEG